MKTSILTLTLCFLSIHIFATDLLVRKSGAGGAFPTITAAIEAATDGDRIIIEPKPGGASYIEDIVINKSLTLQSSRVNGRYLVYGSIKIEAATGRNVTISNIELSENIVMDETIDSENFSSRMLVQVINSKATEIKIYGNNVTTNIYKCSISNKVSIIHGNVIANTINGPLSIFGEETSIPSNDRIHIIANTLKGSYENNATMYIRNDKYEYHIFNNSIIVGNNSNVTFPKGISIIAAKLNSTNIVHNNRIEVSYTTSDLEKNTCALISSSVKTSIWEFQNNVFDLDSRYDRAKLITDESNAATSISLYNGYIRNSNNNVDIESNTISVSSNTSSFENKGNPDIEYSDIDLSRNNLGVLGGSHSKANYFQGNEPQIIFLNVPRRITVGNTFSIEATGISN